MRKGVFISIIVLLVSFICVLIFLIINKSTNQSNDETPVRKKDQRFWIVEKPILYLYPTKKTNVKVEFKNKNILTTTYPKYENSWEVVASPNGDLRDKNGKYYYGLYWEENSNHKVDFKEGFYVTDDNAIEFLESSLSQLGFSDKEANEFIMYWLPILEKNGKNLVYFEQTLEREKYSPIKITPKPDSVLRVAIHVKKVNKKESIKKQKLETFKRSGFTAVEWGGVVY